ncbi:hypothetical protein S2091_2895 [Solimicrobium silvestre]|uniref:Secreted protein n=1 Tax=Solimicrobium silvestre TaxID=2099400 RepID=A0A2S9GXT9_9BURK|nr:hypothetical protein S2091_2895 [Solimicrobium silvestre]
MNITMIKKKLLLLLAIIVFGNYAQPPDVPPKNIKMCWKGPTISYSVGDNEECPDTEIQCKKIGGHWLGDNGETGLGSGCNPPTHDVGKSCKKGSDCEGYCVPEKPASESSACVCSNVKLLYAGVQYCTEHGVTYRPPF